MFFTQLICFEKDNEQENFIIRKKLARGLKHKNKQFRKIRHTRFCVIILPYFPPVFVQLGCPEKWRPNKLFLGAFGTVYLAQRLSDDREVILKQIPGI